MVGGNVFFAEKNITIIIKNKDELVKRTTIRRILRFKVMKTSFNTRRKLKRMEIENFQTPSIVVSGPRALLLTCRNNSTNSEGGEFIVLSEPYGLNTNIMESKRAEFPTRVRH